MKLIRRWLDRRLANKYGGKVKDAWWYEDVKKEDRRRAELRRMILQPANAEERALSFKAVLLSLMDVTSADLEFYLHENGQKILVEHKPTQFRVELAWRDQEEMVRLARKFADAVLERAERSSTTPE